MIRAVVVLLFSFVIISIILPSTVRLQKLNTTEVFNDDEKENANPENGDSEGEDLEENQLFFGTPKLYFLFNELATKTVVNYIESKYSFALKIQLPPPE